jgi:hypothetical protein
MTAKARIQELTNQIKTLEDQAADLHTDAFNLRTEREQLIAQMILDEKLLSESNWEIRLDGGTSVYLEFKDGDAGGPMDTITELARTDYHSWFELADGIRLQFDDNDITLTFKESKQLMPFVKKNKLKVTGTGIIDRLAKLKREAAALEDICHTFNIQG